MEENNTEWLPHLTNEIVSDAHGNLLDAYTVSLEGWRRGLKLRWHIKDSEKFSEIKTWFVDKPGQLFSLSSKDKTHYFFRTRGDKVSNEAVEIGKDKEKTKQVLAKAGVPVPKGKQFDETQSDEVIRNYVSSIGYPVVIKPTDGSFGRGIVTNIQNDEDLDYALIYIRSELKYKDVIVEQYIPGKEYRIYVVGNKVVGAINRIPAHVVGDGIHSVETLIANKNEERRMNPRLISCPINIDDEIIYFLNKAGHTINDIPKKDEKIFLSNKSNISLGGDPVDVLDDLPIEIKNIAVEALGAVPGLPHGAVDLIVHANKPIEEAGVVLELNPTAQIGSLLYPMKGKARDIPAAIIDYYFPETKEQVISKVYFDVDEILAPLANKTATITTVTSLDDKYLYGKKYIVTGSVQHLDFLRWLRVEALEQSLLGTINKLDESEIELVLVGSNKESVDQFKEIIWETDRTEVTGIREENWDKPVKLGFEIQGERKNVINELHEIKKEAIKATKEQKALERKYQNMLNSRIWRMTKPVRKLTGSIKVIYRTISKKK